MSKAPCIHAPPQLDTCPGTLQHLIPPCSIPLRSGSQQPNGLLLTSPTPTLLSTDTPQPLRARHLLGAHQATPYEQQPRAQHAQTCHTGTKVYPWSRHVPVHYLMSSFTVIRCRVCAEHTRMRQHHKQKGSPRDDRQGNAGVGAGSPLCLCSRLYVHQTPMHKRPLLHARHHSNSQEGSGVTLPPWAAYHMGCSRWSKTLACRKPACHSYTHAPALLKTLSTLQSHRCKLTSHYVLCTLSAGPAGRHRHAGQVQHTGMATSSTQAWHTAMATSSTQAWQPAAHRHGTRPWQPAGPPKGCRRPLMPWTGHRGR
jgi:hypothetical protein